MADKKDEIIAKQLEVIRTMTENNMRRLADDVWGDKKNSNTSNTSKNPQTVKKTPDQNGQNTPKKASEIDFSDLYKNDLPKEPEIPDLTGFLNELQKNNSDKNPPPMDFSNIKVNPVSPNTNSPSESKNDNPPTATSNDSDKPEVNIIPEEPIATIEELKAELDGYIGLDNIKKEVKNLINMMTIYQKRKENDLPTVDMSLHMVFSGNPGTGKTMIARLMARIYRTLGILSKGQLVEVDRSGLVAGYVGQTALKTTKVLEKAMGGVLFIDEAYTLTTKSENDFGFEAVDTILKAMEDNRDDLVVIVAGYIELMEDFIESNPGLRSRFNKYLNFEDYTSDEMFRIFESQCRKSCYTIDEEAETSIKAYFKICELGSASFGNARGVRNTFEKILTAQANRLALMEEITRDDLMLIKKEDVRVAAYGESPEAEAKDKDKEEETITENSETESDNSENKNTQTEDEQNEHDEHST